MEVVWKLQFPFSDKENECEKPELEITARVSASTDQQYRKSNIPPSCTRDLRM